MCQPQTQLPQASKTSCGNKETPVEDTETLEKNDQQTEKQTEKQTKKPTNQHRKQQQNQKKKSAEKEVMFSQNIPEKETLNIILLCFILV